MQIDFFFKITLIMTKINIEGFVFSVLITTWFDRLYDLYKRGQNTLVLQL